MTDELEIALKFVIVSAVGLLAGYKIHKALWRLWLHG